MMFVGFIDGPRAIKYYNACTRHVGTTQNFHFANTPPNIQFEGEDQLDQPDQPTIDQIDPSVEYTQRKRPNDYPSPIERNLQPRKRVNYRLLDKPPLAYDPSLELMALAQSDPEEESVIFSPNEVIGAILDRPNLASEDPQSLAEVRKSSEWPEWENSIQIELQQLADRQTWNMADLPDEHIPIKNKWVFQKKFNKQVTLTKHKA